MPSKYQEQPGSALTWGTQALRARPHHAYMIGLIAAEWSHLETELSFMFAILMGTQSISPSGQYSYTENSLANIALGDIYGMKPRLRLIRTALATLLSPADQEALNGCLEHVNRAGERRNDVVHGKWALDLTLPEHVVLATKKGLAIYSIPDFEELLADISRATWQFGSFMRDWLAVREQELRAGAS